MPNELIPEWLNLDLQLPGEKCETAVERDLLVSDPTTLPFTFTFTFTSLHFTLSTSLS